MLLSCPHLSVPRRLCECQPEIKNIVFFFIHFVLFNNNKNSNTNSSTNCLSTPRYFVSAALKKWLDFLSLVNHAVYPLYQLQLTFLKKKMSFSGWSPCFLSDYHSKVDHPVYQTLAFSPKGDYLAYTAETLSEIWWWRSWNLMIRWYRNMMTWYAFTMTWWCGLVMGSLPMRKTVKKADNVRLGRPPP